MKHNFVSSSISMILPDLMEELLQADEVGSRNGRATELTHVGITLTDPLKREITTPGRKANIAAQIAETAWMLAGRDDVEWLSHYLPRAKDFSDDGETWRGAYGPRIRSFGTEMVDQLKNVVDLLRRDPLTRRAVIAIYDPSIDAEDGKDIPCNDFLMFTNRHGELDLQVATRSNDLMWGWSGINAFEWSVLQEVVAGLVGVGVGSLHFSIASLHLYEKHWAKARRIADMVEPEPAFPAPRIRFQPADLNAFDKALTYFFLVEQKIREGHKSSGVDYMINTFQDPMLRSWLRVLRWWWTGDRTHLEPLSGTQLEYATRRSMAPPSRAQSLCEKCGEGQVSTSGGRTPLKCIRASCNHVQGNPIGSDFIRAAIELHNEKHAAYGDSWKKRGEQMSILANIARKVDRLGGGETSDETTVDTAMDLMIYLAKYETWLRGMSDDHAEANRVLLRVDHQSVIPVSVEGISSWFDDLEFAVTNGQAAKEDIAHDLLCQAYSLAKKLWENDDYRGADVD